MDWDPHSGDYGLGFFGNALESGAYFVEHPRLGPLCFLCTAEEDQAEGLTTITPVGRSLLQKCPLRDVGMSRCLKSRCARAPHVSFRRTPTTVGSSSSRFRCTSSRMQG